MIFSGFTLSLVTAVAGSSIASGDTKENILEVGTNHTIDHERISSALGYSEPTLSPCKSICILITKLSDFENFELRQEEPNSHPKLGATWLFGKCAEGEYKHWITGCQSCPGGCAICKGSAFRGPECQLCETGLYLDDNNDCVSCKTNCAECTSAKCTKCAKGYESLDSGDTCTLIDCLDGYYLDSFNNRCNDCPTATHCTKCSDATTCDECEVGYYLDTASKTCKLCHASCETCFGAAQN